MKILNYNNINKQKWHEYVFNHPKGSIFHTPEMYDTFNYSERSKSLFFAVESENNKISGLILGEVYEELFSFFGLTKRILFYSEPLYDTIDVLEMLLQLINKDGKGIFFQIRNQFELNSEEKLLYAKYGFRYKDHLSAEINIINKDIIWNRLSYDKKKNIKKAKKIGILLKEQKTCKDLDIFYSLISDLYKKAKHPCKSKSYFHSILQNDFAQLIIAYFNSEPVAAQLFLKFKNKIIALYTATKFDARYLNAGDVIIWRLIEIALENKCNILDLGGGGNPLKKYGPRDYKGRFGTNFNNIGRYTKSNSIFFSCIYWIFNLNLWSKTQSACILHNNSIKVNDWDRLLKANSFSTPFQTHTFYESMNKISSGSSEVFAIKNNNELQALCVVTLLKEPGYKGYFSRRGIIYGGPIVKEGATDALEILLNKVKVYFKGKIIYNEIRNFHNYDIYKPIFVKNGWSYVPHLNINLSLNGKTITSLLADMHYSRRREIKLSLKEKAYYEECKEEQDLIDFYNILSDLYKSKLSLPLPSINFFQVFSQSKIAKLFIVKHGNKVIGGSFCMIFGKEKLYTMYYTGLKNYHKKIFPSHLSLLACFEYAINQEIKVIDFMGAGSPKINYGVRDYKLKFSGDLVEYGRYISI